MILRAGWRAGLVALLALSPGCDRAVDSAAPPTPALSILPDTLPLAEALEEARRIYDDGKLRESLDWFVAIADAATERNEVAVEAEARTFACFANRHLGTLEAGREQCQRALRITEDHDLAEQRVITLNALGLIAWLQTRLPEAESLYQASADLARRMDDDLGVARANGNIGLVLVEYGDFAGARQAFEAYRDAGRELGRPSYEANALTNLGMLSIWTGDPDSAFAPLEEARRIYGANDDTYYEVNAIGQLAAAWAALGRQDRALIMIDSALARASESEQQQEIASNLEILAGLAHASGDHAEALRLYDRARSLNEAAGYRLENAGTLRAQARILFTIGDTAAAMARVEEALAMHGELASPLATLRDHVVLAELSAATGDVSGARSHIADARSYVEALDARLPRAEVAIGEAAVLDRSGDAEGVLRVLDAAADDLDGLGYGLSWQADVLRARALARLGRLEAAAQTGRRAIRMVEAQRLRIGSERRTSFLASRLDAYTDLAGVLLALDRVEEAFEVSDAARGRAFLDHAASAPRATRTALGLPEQPAAAAAMQKLDASIDSLLVQPPEDRHEPTLDSLEARLSSLLGETPSAVAGSLIGSGGIDAARIRSSLQPGEALVEYFLADSGSIAFVLDRDSIQAVPIDGNIDDLVRRGRIARDLLSEPDGNGAADDIAATLYTTLVAPVLRSPAAAGAQRWFIVPHGPISYLPFAALRNSATGRYVVQDRFVQVLPSAAALPLLRDRSRGAWQPSTASVFAPAPTDLPATADEARSIVSAVSGAQAMIGNAATEPALRRHLGAGRAIVHVAGHALLQPENPMGSRLELVRGGDGPDDDGHLELREVLALDIDSHLVFLSGCETGAGLAFATSFSRADDTATLAQAFLFAGADNVIATLWRIEDAGAAEFARAFYSHLRTTPAADALALAQRDMLADERYRAPFYWAAYQLTGADLPRAAQTVVPVSVGIR